MQDFLNTLGRVFRERIGWKRIGLLASLLIVGLAINHLVHALKGVNTDVVLAALENKSHTQILLAALCVFCAFCTLTFYDFFALRTIGKMHVPYRIAALSSFASYSIGHNIGATVFTGGAIRFRIYSDWGLNAIDVAKICFISGLTFWLGNTFVLGIGMMWHPSAASAIDLLPESINQLIGFGFLFGICSYLLWLALGRNRRELGRDGWKVVLPSAPFTLLQIMIGVVDLGFCALAMYILIPDTPHTYFVSMAVVFILATLLGFASHAPGSIGSVRCGDAYRIAAIRARGTAGLAADVPHPVFPDSVRARHLHDGSARIVAQRGAALASAQDGIKPRARGRPNRQIPTASRVTAVRRAGFELSSRAPRNTVFDAGMRRLKIVFLFAALIAPSAHAQSTAEPPAAAPPPVAAPPAAVPSSDNGMQISWEVRNRFRLFREERDFLIHSETLAGRNILGSEDALEVQSEGRGWARNTLNRLCIDLTGRVNEPCTRDGVKESYLTPADHPITMRLTGTVPVGAICAWTIDDGAGAPRQFTGDCGEPINFRAPYGRGHRRSASMSRAGSEPAQRVTEQITVRDIFIAGLGDSIASGEGQSRPSGRTRRRWVFAIARISAVRPDNISGRAAPATKARAPAIRPMPSATPCRLAAIGRTMVQRRLPSFALQLSDAHRAGAGDAIPAYRGDLSAAGLLGRDHHGRHARPAARARMSLHQDHDELRDRRQPADRRTPQRDRRGETPTARPPDRSRAVVDRRQ